MSSITLEILGLYDYDLPSENLHLNKATKTFFSFQGLQFSERMDSIS